MIWRHIANLSYLDLLLVTEMSSKHINHLPLPMLPCRSRTFRAHTTINDTSVALPVAIRLVVVGVRIRCAGAGFEKGGRGAVGHALFWVVADWSGTSGGFYDTRVSLLLGLRGRMDGVGEMDWDVWGAQIYVLEISWDIELGREMGGSNGTYCFGQVWPSWNSAGGER